MSISLMRSKNLLRFCLWLYGYYHFETVISKEVENLAVSHKKKHFLFASLKNVNIDLNYRTGGLYRLLLK